MGPTVAPFSIKWFVLVDSDYPLPYIITDATTTLLAILTMFALLRMECTQVKITMEIMMEVNKISITVFFLKILAEAEEMWQQQPTVPARLVQPHHPPSHCFYSCCHHRHDHHHHDHDDDDDKMVFQRGRHKLNGVVKRSFKSAGRLKYSPSKRSHWWWWTMFTEHWWWWWPTWRNVSS